MKRTNGNGLNGSQGNQSKTLTENHFLFKVTNSQKMKLRRNVFKFHLFTLSLHFDASSDLFRGEEERERKKSWNTWVWRASRGEVQVCHSSSASRYKKKMLQLVRRFCRQDRLRGKTPVVCYVRLGNGRSAFSWVMQCISPQHCDFISSSLSLSTHLCEARASVGSPPCSVSYD